jgi:oxalate decarboxylase
MSFLDREHTIARECEVSIARQVHAAWIAGNWGGVRELHWHTANEWAIMLYGTARITVLDADGKSRCEENDLWYFPSGLPHSIQGLESDGAEFMLVFDDGDFSESDTMKSSIAANHLLEALPRRYEVCKIFRKDAPFPFESSAFNGTQQPFLATIERAMGLTLPSEPAELSLVRRHKKSPAGGAKIRRYFDIADLFQFFLTFFCIFWYRRRTRGFVTP